MKLKLIERSGAPRDGRPMVTFGAKGTLSINVYAIRQFNLKAGLQVGIIQDEEKPDHFYLWVGKNSSLPTLRDTAGSKSLICGYVDAVAAFESRFGKLEKSAQVILGELVDSEYGDLTTLVTAPFIHARNNAKK
jgi:hypothetical protein